MKRGEMGDKFGVNSGVKEFTIEPEFAVLTEVITDKIKGRVMERMFEERTQYV